MKPAFLQKISQLVWIYNSTPEKQTISHITIEIPGHKGRFWIIDPMCLLLEPGHAGQLAIYFSINTISRKAKSCLLSEKLPELFDGYKQSNDGRLMSFSKLFSTKGSIIGTEIINKIDALFPACDYEKVCVHLIEKKDWMRLEEDGLSG